MKKLTACRRAFLFRALSLVTKPFRGRGLLPRHPRLQKIYSLYKFLYNATKPNEIVIWGQKFYLDKPDDLELGRQLENYEIKTAEVFRNEIKKGDTVLDVGANIGFFTVLFAKLVGASGRVFAFEPDPVYFGLLGKNVKSGNYQNVTLVKKAVAAKSDPRAGFFVGGTLATPDNYDFYTSAGHAERRVEVTTLDEFLKDYDGRIDFIKMDIEGAEGLALAGMLKLLSKNKNVKIVSEFSPRLLARSGADPADYLCSLEELGFFLYDINGSFGTEKRVSAPHLLKIYAPGSVPDYTNLFLRS